MILEAQSLTQQIHRLSRADIPRLSALADQMRMFKDADYFERNFDFIEKNEREAFLIAQNGQDAGYCFLNWHPKYALFKKMEIPEIQDLCITPTFRRLGLARMLIEYCEARAHAKKSTHIGLGVAVNGQFGPAQILYAKLGYIPDGNGVTYDRQILAAGEFRPLDDQLCLMMIKDLTKKTSSNDVINQ